MKIKKEYLVKIHHVEEEEEIVHVMNISQSDHVALCGADGGVSWDNEVILPLSDDDKMNCPHCFSYVDNLDMIRVNDDWLSEKLLLKEKPSLKKRLNERFSNVEKTRKEQERTLKNKE